MLKQHYTLLFHNPPPPILSRSRTQTHPLSLINHYHNCQHTHSRNKRRRKCNKVLTVLDKVTQSLVSRYLPAPGINQIVGSLPIPPGYEYQVMSYDRVQLSFHPALFKSRMLITLLLCPSASPVSEDIWNRLPEALRCRLSLKSQWQPQTGLVRPLEGSWILPVRCAHINTPPGLAGNQFSSLFLPPLGNVPTFGICPCLPCSAQETKKSFCFSSHLSYFFFFFSFF